MSEYDDCECAAGMCYDDGRVHVHLIVLALFFMSRYFFLSSCCNG